MQKTESNSLIDTYKETIDILCNQIIEDVNINPKSYSENPHLIRMHLTLFSSDESFIHFNDSYYKLISLLFKYDFVMSEKEINERSVEAVLEKHGIKDVCKHCGGSGEKYVFDTNKFIKCDCKS